MKITPSEKRSLLPYLLFCSVFAGILVLMIFLGHWLSRGQTETYQEQDASFPVVVIDAGHGGEDGGAVGISGVYEKDLNLKIAEYLEQMLRANGIPTLMTRTEDILLYDRNSDYHGQKKVQDLAARRKIAESLDSAVFISIHMNAFPDPRYGGLQVYYSENDTASRILAEDIQHRTTDLLLPQNRRKTKPSNGSVYLLDRLQCPAVLVECGFLSNPEECARLSEEDYQKQMATVLCLSILNYLKAETENPSPGS